jgi:5'-3' exonuclease
MGIKGYCKWISDKYPNAFKSKWLEYYDNVYIDLNYCLHYCSYGVKSQDELFCRLFAFIDSILIETKPLRSITFSTDGPAPFAKLFLQRKRRECMAEQQLNLQTSSLIFTPGTEFMNELPNKLQPYIKQLELIYCVNVLFTKETYDEAEIKLKKYLMLNQSKYPDDTHIIISNDADIVVMMLTLANPNHTFVFYKNTQSKSNKVLCVGQLLGLHLEAVGYSETPGYDFATLSIMLGNDYLPKISYLTFNNIWDSYAEALLLTQSKKSMKNKKFFIKFLHSLICRLKPHYVRKFTIQTFSNNLCANYLDGLLWCLDMYESGRCCAYDYMYVDTNTPHPLGLLVILSDTKYKFKPNIIAYPPLNPRLYAMLILPPRAIELIDKMYHKLYQQIQKSNIIGLADIERISNKYAEYES